MLNNVTWVSKVLFFSFILSLPFRGHIAHAAYESSQHEVPDFDIENSAANLALAHIEAAKGKLTEALFSLERAIALDPDNVEARFLMGTIYAKLGEKDSAAKQFKYLVDENTEQSAAAQVALEDLKYVREWHHSAVVGYRIGHDDNVNSGLDNTAIFIPSINASLLLPDSTGENEATTHTVYAAGNLHYQHTDNLSYVIKGTAAKTDDDFFNQSYLALNLGARLSQNKTQHSLRFIQSYQDYDNFDQIHISRLNYEYLRQLKKRNYYKLALDLQYVNYDEQDIRDDNRLTLSGQYRHFLSPNLDLTSAFFYTQDIKSENNFAHLDFDTYGAKSVLNKSLNTKLALSLGLEYRINNYHDEDTLFLEDRLDKRLLIRSKLSWEFAQRTKLSLAYQYTDNDSNISLYDFNKNIVFIEVATAF